MVKITVTTQAEFDAIDSDFSGEIHITGSIDRVTKSFDNAEIYVSDNATIRYVYGNATIRYVYGNATIRYVSDNATIRYVSDNATISNVSDNATISNVSGNATISNVYGNATISNVSDNATISNVSDNATIRYVSGNATISNVSGNATIRYVYGNATIRYVSDNATIRYVSDNATISNVSDNATISNVSDNATISNVYGNATIRYVYGNATISNVSDNATISNVSDNATIRYVSGNATILCCSGRAKIESNGLLITIVIGSSLAITAGPDTKVIEERKKEANFDWYTKSYPCEIIDGCAILYKAVHKTEDGIFHADKDHDFIYEVGQKREGKCNESIEQSCTYGLHISNKIWAIGFGKSWSNMALLECSVPIDKIVVAKDCDGKIRTSELTVLREVPESEWFD